MLSPIENISPTKTLNVSAPSYVEDHSKYDQIINQMNEELQKLLHSNQELTEQNQLLDIKFNQCRISTEESQIQRIQEKKMYEGWITQLLKEKSYLENELIWSSEMIKRV